MEPRYPEDMSFWTRNPPTDEGYYWAIKNDGQPPSMRPVIVELGRSYANGPLEIRDFLRESVDFADSDLCEVLWWGPQIERPSTPPPES